LQPTPGASIGPVPWYADLLFRNCDDVDITTALINWRDVSASDRETVMATLYTELRTIARRHLARERADVLLEPAMLVNEAYMKLAGPNVITWQGRAHFLAMASRIMRQILVDHARQRMALKRDQGAPLAMTLSPADRTVSTSIYMVEEGLRRLGEIDPFYVSVVEARYFGGLTVEETAESLGVSPSTVKRAWSAARAWLLVYFESAE
jgi:RNA polymerase sigma-70 factor (ECF subfamily)